MLLFNAIQEIIRIHEMELDRITNEMIHAGAPYAVYGRQLHYVFDGLKEMRLKAITIILRTLIRGFLSPDCVLMRSQRRRLYDRNVFISVMTMYLKV